MPDLLEQSQEWLTSMNRIYRSRQVIYARGALEKEIPALVGKTVFRVDNGYGLFERVEARDYLIEVADLAQFGEPARGDRVKETLNGKVELFEVMAPNGEDVFRYSDSYRKVFRIHTKHVGTEPT